MDLAEPWSQDVCNERLPVPAFYVASSEPRAQSSGPKYRDVLDNPYVTLLKTKICLECLGQKYAQTAADE